MHLDFIQYIIINYKAFTCALLQLPAVEGRREGSTSASFPVMAIVIALIDKENGYDFDSTLCFIEKSPQLARKEFDERA